VLSVVLQCADFTCLVLQSACRHFSCCNVHADTGWRRLIGSLKLQIIFHKRATEYRSLLRKMTYEHKGSYESSPPCMYLVAIWTCNVLSLVAMCRCCVLSLVATCGSVLQCFAVFCSVLQCVAVCCSVLQCVAVCRSVL